MPTARTDAELMAAFQQGEVGAFEELVQRHHRGLVNYFYHHARDRQLAEDWAQEVFLRVVTHAAGYVPRARFTTFLYHIARNLWIDVVRERSVHRRPASLDGQDAEGDRREEWVASAARRPDDLLARDEVSSQVRCAIDQLPEELREVVILSELQGLKYAEIGEAMGIPVGTVKSRMHTAVQRLRTLLAPLADGFRSGPSSGAAAAGGAGGALALLLLAAAWGGAGLPAAETPAPAAPASPPAADEPVGALVGRLSLDDVAERDAALQALVARGAAAVPALADRLAAGGDPEGAARAREALRRIGWPAIVHLTGRADTSPPLAEVRESCVRAFLEQALGARVLEGNDWTEGEAPAADAARLSAVWETGSGHGFTLRLYRLFREGEALRARRISYDAGRHPYTSPNPPEHYPVKVQTALLEPAAAQALFAVALRACSIRITPKDAREPVVAVGGQVRGGRRRLWGSTADFHVRVRFEQDGRAVFDESYTGYPGSAREQNYVRPDAVSGVLAAAFRGVAWVEQAADEADRAFLLERTGRFGEDAWWVRERLLVVVGALGDRRFEPFLRKAIAMPMDGATRHHYYAMNAYARITGLDLRSRPVEEMDVAAVREAYLARFAAGSASTEPEER